MDVTDHEAAGGTAAPGCLSTLQRYTSRMVDHHVLQPHAFLGWVFPIHGCGKCCHVLGTSLNPLQLELCGHPSDTMKRYLPIVDVRCKAPGRRACPPTGGVAPNQNLESSSLSPDEFVPPSLKCHDTHLVMSTACLPAQCVLFLHDQVATYRM